MRRCLMRNAALFSKNRRAVAGHGGLSLADWRRDKRHDKQGADTLAAKAAKGQSTPALPTVDHVVLER